MKNKVIKYVNTNLQQRNSLGNLVSGKQYIEKIDFSTSSSINSKLIVKDLGNGYGEILSTKSK